MNLEKIYTEDKEKRYSILNRYLWYDGETAEKIYYEAAFRYVETKQAGRATCKTT